MQSSYNVLIQYQNQAHQERQQLLHQRAVFWCDEQENKIAGKIHMIANSEQAAAYYTAARDLQTISWSLGGNIGGFAPSYFVGTITIQASLAVSPGVFDWFDVYSVPVDSTEAGQAVAVAEPYLQGLWYPIIIGAICFIIGAIYVDGKSTSHKH